MRQILVVDDDRVVQQVVIMALRDHDYQVSVAQSGAEALDIITQQHPDLVILDIIMPDLDGFEVCRRIRTNPFTGKIPILFLTSRDRPADRARGLDAGSDDFVSKSAISTQLLARVRAILRRSAPDDSDYERHALTVGGVRLFATQREVEIGDRVIALTPVEHRLLGYLMVHAQQPVSAQQLLEHVWDYPPGAGDGEVVRVTINRLRAKLEPNLETTPYIKSIRGQGYMIAL
jgi:two-component system OmpR family response regulator